MLCYVNNTAAARGKLIFCQFAETHAASRLIKASSLCGERSRIELHIKPLIGNRVVSQLRLAEIARLLDVGELRSVLEIK